MTRTASLGSEQPAIRLPVFEGPLGLLLALVEQRRLDVTEVSLAAVADQYLEAVRSLPDPHPDLLAEFVAVAGRLLLLKSRALLPRPVELAADDPLVDLEQRLAEYRRVRDAAAQLECLEARNQPAFAALPRRIESPEPVLVAPTARELFQHAWRLLRRAPVEIQRRVVEPVVRVLVEARVAYLLALLAAQPRLAWERAAGARRDEVVATLLAALELFKRGRLGLEQELPRGQLWLVRAGEGLAIPLGNGAAGREPQQVQERPVVVEV